MKTSNNCVLTTKFQHYVGFLVWDIYGYYKKFKNLNRCKTNI